MFFSCLSQGRSVEISLELMCDPVSKHPSQLKCFEESQAELQLLSMHKPHMLQQGPRLLALKIATGQHAQIAKQPQTQEASTCPAVMCPNSQLLVLFLAKLLTAHTAYSLEQTRMEPFLQQQGPEEQEPRAWSLGQNRKECCSSGLNNLASQRAGPTVSTRSSSRPGQ